MSEPNTEISQAWFQTSPCECRYSAVYFQKSGCSTLSLVLSQCRGAAAVQRRQEALIYHQVCLCAEHLIFRTKRVWTWTSIISASRHDREEVKKKKIMRIQPESQWATFQVPVTTLTGSKRSRKGDVFTRDWNVNRYLWIYFPKNELCIGCPLWE